MLLHCMQHSQACADWYADMLKLPAAAAAVALPVIALQATAPGSYQPQFGGGFGRGGAQ
jgi:hypothetical protein